MSEQLKPCPFCHSDQVSVCMPTCTKDTPYDAAHRAFPIAHCMSCWASKQGNDWDHSGKSAIDAWNTRVVRHAPEPYGPSDEQIDKEDVIMRAADSLGKLAGWAEILNVDTKVRAEVDRINAGLTLGLAAARATQPQAPQGAVTDTKRIDWLEGLTKVSSHGLSNCAPALFTIMPAWDQKGAAYTTLRESIDAAIEAAAPNPETPKGQL